MRLTSLLDRHRVSILVVLLAVTVGMAISALKVRFDFTPQAVYSSGDDDDVKYSEDFKKVFGYDDAVILVVMEALGERDVLDRAALTWQAAIAGDLGRIEDVVRVVALATTKAPRPNPAGPPWIVAEPLIAEFPVTAAAEERMRTMLGPEGPDMTGLLSDDRRASSVMVHLDPDGRDIRTTRRVVRAVRSAIQARGAPAGYAIHLGGLPTIRTDIVDDLGASQTTQMPLAALLYVVILALIFRRLSGTLLPLLAVGVGVCWTFGAISLLGMRLNIISNVLPILLFVIGIANCVHILSRYVEESERTPADRRGAAKRTIAAMSPACLLAYLTTAIGLGSLVAANSTVVREVGVQAVMGVCLLFVATMAILATLLPLFRPPRRLALGAAGVDPIGRVLGAGGYTVARRPWLTVLCSLAVVAAALWLGRRVTVNSSMFETYDADHPTRRTMRLIEDHLGGVVPIDVSLQASSPDRLLDAEVLERVLGVQRYAVSLDGVVAARSYADMHLRAERRGAATAPGEGGPTPRFEKDRVRLTDRILREAADATNYHAFVSSDGTRARITLRVRDVGTRRLLELMADLDGRLARAFPPGGGIEARLTGDACVHAKGMDRFVRDFFTSLLFASVVIFGVIGVLFRSLRAGMIAVLPNMTPLIVTLGYMGLRGLDLNAGNVVVFGISIGIAVDDTIHFLARFHEEIELDGDVAHAIRRSYRGSGRAIVLTSMLVVGGLSVLLFSKFVPNRRFAELVGVTMGAALVGDLLLLPACLAIFWRPKTPPPALPLAV